MALTPGTRLGVYEISAQIGEGGMGAVYRATDTSLNRQVAIKVLPDVFAADPDRLARFEREAKMLASLNHPNIAGIYGFEKSSGLHALVMELVDGDDLSQRIARGGAMALDEALPIAKQIAEALEAAHEQGIIHRDLKPANIKVRPDGTVKVLDFGLAKAMEPAAGSSPSMSMSPTLSLQATQAGMILGTAAYMSPEQAKGRQVDRRTDIFAFGCVLYELLTGRQAFGGEDIAGILARVLEREPDWNLLPPDTPPAVVRLLRRALTKDVRHRLGDIRDARLEIEEAAAEPATVRADVRSPGTSRLWALSFGFAGLLAAVLAYPAVVHLREAPPAPAPELRLELSTPATSQPQDLAISPDGSRIGFVATFNGRPSLWLRSLNADSFRVLPGTEGAWLPFWSEDGRSLGFFADARLKRVDIDGGTVKTLASASYGVGGAWNRDGIILFTPMPGRPIQRMNANGLSPPERVVGTDQADRGWYARFLPGGRDLLYYTLRGTYLGRVEGTAGRLLIDGAYPLSYVTSGHLVFGRADGTLFAQPFDVRRLELTGNAVPFVERVGSWGGFVAASVASNGAIAYRRASDDPDSQLVWVNRAGQELARVPVVADGLSLTMPSMSPDETRLAVMRWGINEPSDLWLLDVERGIMSRFTSGDGGDNVFPVWSPDGSQIVFDSLRGGGVHNLYVKSLNDGGAGELVLKTSDDKIPTDWSADGRHVLYYTFDPRTQNDIWALSMSDRKPFPVVQTEFEERSAKLSPDGRWIAYQSNESGRFEIYMQPFRGPGLKTRISANGGAQVRWRHDNRELFYMALDGRLVAVPIRVARDDQSLEAGTPTPLFDARPYRPVEHLDGPQYVVSADGQRFLVNRRIEDSKTPPISVVLNWKRSNSLSTP